MLTITIEREFTANLVRWFFIDFRDARKPLDVGRYWGTENLARTMARKLDEILVVDVESTCWDGPPPEGEESEIIEIGLSVVDVGSLTRMSKHSILVKPERSTISSFCTELTTLTPEMLTEAGTLVDACKRLKKDFSSKDRLWASWGDYPPFSTPSSTRVQSSKYGRCPAGPNAVSIFSRSLNFSLARTLPISRPSNGPFSL